MITECDLLQISHLSNWGKIYRTIYPINIFDPMKLYSSIGVIYADQHNNPRPVMEK